ncbi:LysR family transcriptional regulator [Streptomyces sp. URMC 126]|uniref:LysR family transcriptional regulator n=1 Tax=Streptomyces sp. URMC 126 TaxID=3423401 RepID=UPI003F1C4766
MSLGVEEAPAADGPETPSPFGRRDLALLAAVDRYGDLAEAARRAGIRQGAAARRLDRLDRAVGAPLTLRTPHAARLTPAGSRMLVAGRRFFRRTDLAARIHLLGHGREAVTAPEVLHLATAEPLPEEVVEDAAASLGLLLSVRHEEPHRIAAQWADYLVDAAFTRTTDASHSASDRPTRVHHVLDDPLWVILPRDHPLAGRPEIPLAALRDDTWVSQAGPRAESLVAHVFRTAGLPAPARLHVAGPSVVRGMLSRGDATGLGSPTDPAVHAPSLVHRSLAERPRRTAGLLVDPAVVPPATAARLAALIARGHLRRLAAHHADLLREPWWERWYAEQAARPAGATGAGPLADAAPPPAEGRALDVEDLDLLRAVARHGSINRAAAVLSISQSALTRRIHRLEHALGARLLLRSPRGTTLTEPTRRFLRLLDGYEADFHEEALACRAGRHPLRGGRAARAAAAAYRPGAQLAPSAT